MPCHHHYQVTEASSICIFDFLLKPAPVQASTTLAPHKGRISNNIRCPSWQGLPTKWNSSCLRRSQRHLSVLANTEAMFMRGRVGWKRKRIKILLNSKTTLYNLSFVRVRGKMKMRSWVEFAYARFLSTSGGWQRFILIQLWHLILDPWYFRAPWSCRAKFCYSEKHTGMDGTEYVLLSPLGQKFMNFCSTI